MSDFVALALHLFLWIMTLPSTVFAATLAYSGFAFLDLALDVHGRFGLAQDIGLSIVALPPYVRLHRIFIQKHCINKGK